MNDINLTSEELLDDKNSDIERAIVLISFNWPKCPVTNYIDAYILHELLKKKIGYQEWFKSIIEGYGYVQGEDYFLHEKMPDTFPYSHSTYLTLDMAKEICLLDKSDIGMFTRRSIIEISKESV